MVWPITGAESYVRETVKSMKALDLAVVQVIVGDKSPHEQSRYRIYTSRTQEAVVEDFRLRARKSETPNSNTGTAYARAMLTESTSLMPYAFCPSSFAYRVMATRMGFGRFWNHAMYVACD